MSRSRRFRRPSATLGSGGLGGKIGALVGVTADQILVNDLAVNPIAKNTARRW